jgi:Rieske Fe-S protein
MHGLKHKEANTMADKKHFIFSARTTEEGLKTLNKLRKERGVGWDGLVLDAVCTHYGLDVAVMAAPKKMKTDKAKPKRGTSGEAKNEKRGEANERGKRQKNGQKVTIRA